MKPGTLKTKGAIRVYRGDLGSQEMLELRTWKVRGGGGQYKLRAVGHYDVYGSDGEARIPLDVETQVFPDAQDEWGGSLRELLAGEANAASELLDTLIEWGVDDWMLAGCP